MSWFIALVLAATEGMVAADNEGISYPDEVKIYYGEQLFSTERYGNRASFAFLLLSEKKKYNQNSDLQD